MAEQQPGAPPPVLARLPGAATPLGPEYEWKLAGLLALRARRRGLRFQVFSNVAAAQPMDDVVLRVLGPSAHVVFVQLKHANTTAPVTSQALTSSSKGDFTLRKYFEFFSECQRKHSAAGSLTGDDALLHQSALDDMRMVLFTNRRVARAAGAGDAPHHPFPYEDLFHTAPPTTGNVFSFGYKDLQVWNLFANDPENDIYRHEFLPRLRVFSEQIHVTGLDGLIKEELDAVFDVPLPRGENFLSGFIASLKAWSLDTNGAPLSDSSGELETLLVEDLVKQGLLAAAAGRLVFEEERCLELKKVLTRMSRGSLYIKVPGVPQGLRAAKILQVLQGPWAGSWVCVSDQTLREFPSAALVAACSACSFLVLDVDKELQAAQALISAVRDDLKVVIITSGESDPTLEGPKPKWERPEEDWKLKDLTSDAQNQLMNTRVLFQGEAMLLRELEPLWPELRGEVGGPLLSSLVTSRKGGPLPAIGAKLMIPDDVKRPILRSVYHNTTLDDAVLTALSTSTHLFALTGFTKEGTENISKFLFKDGPVLDYSFSDSRRGVSLYLFLLSLKRKFRNARLLNF